MMGSSYAQLSSCLVKFWLNTYDSARQTDSLEYKGIQVHNQGCEDSMQGDGQ